MYRRPTAGTLNGLLLLALLVLCCSKGGAGGTPATVTDYQLEITMDGLIAYVPESNHLWALLVNANYDPSGDPSKIPPDALPPYAKQDFDPSDLTDAFPPHLAALSFTGATATFNGTPLGNYVPAILLQGRDIKFATGTNNKVKSMKLGQLAGRVKIFKARRGTGSADAFAAYDVVAKKFLDPDFAIATVGNFLAARVYLDFGSIDAEPLTCPDTSPRAYSFRKATVDDSMDPVQLAEEVTLIETGIKQPIDISLTPPGHGATPDHLVLVPTAAKVYVHVMNVMPKVIADPYFNACGDTDFHLDAYRWFYRLLKDPPADHSLHFIPSLLDGDFGGSKCPGLGGTPPQ